MSPLSLSQPGAPWLCYQRNLRSCLLTRVPTMSASPLSLHVSTCVSFQGTFRVPRRWGFRGRAMNSTRHVSRTPFSVIAKASESESVSAGRAQAIVAFAAAVALSAFATNPPPSLAGGDSTVVSEFNASGIVFKDSVQVVSLEDPLVDGVNIYLSDFKRSVSAKLSSGDVFSEPSQTSLACTRDESGISVRGDLGGKEGKELFSQSKNLSLFNRKNLKVRRIYDPGNNAILYVSYSTRTSSSDSEGPSAGQYKTSVCAVPLRPGEAAVATLAK